MAEKLGVDPATLMGWEAGRHQPFLKKLKLTEEFLR
jgi:transcriptional regulator with XRE-family HTH domain